MTNQKTVGLVVAPGVTERLAENLIQEMPKMLSTHYDHQQEWIFDLVTDPLTGFAESVDEIFEKVADYHDKRQWDYVIAITDLPMFADKQVMALDINMENGNFLHGFDKIVQDTPEKLNGFGKVDSDVVPWPTLFFGMFFNNLFFWCANQMIVQKASA